eukprot:7955027-Lingulodinium_polyedra.AAC.1
MRCLVARGFCLPNVKRPWHSKIDINATQAKQRFLTLKCATVCVFKQQGVRRNANPAPQRPETHGIETCNPGTHGELQILASKCVTIFAR